MSEKDNKEWRSGVYLTTVHDSISAMIIESKLKSEGIPVEKRYKGAGNFMEIALGVNSTCPIELYVPEETLTDALNIIVPVPIDEDFDASGDGKIRMAVIGDPIGHSLSPTIHGDIIRRHGINASYEAIHVKPDELEGFVWGGPATELAGFNATMPHKQALLGLVDEIDPEAEEYGAINTVKNDNGTLIGYNTDVKGLILALAAQGVTLKNKTLLLLGAGGVAGSLLIGGLNAGAKKVIVLNRTADKAEKLCVGKEWCQGEGMSQESLKKYSPEADVIINCTPVGMSGVGGVFEDFTFLDKTDAFLCDLIYNPWETEFLKYGRQKGLRGINGIDMLIYQGILAFEIFTGIKLEYRVEHDNLYEICKKSLGVE